MIIWLTIAFICFSIFIIRIIERKYKKEFKGKSMEWISIEERLPPPDAYILISKYDKRKTIKMPFLSIGYRIEEEWFEKNGKKVDQKDGNITHWMPLPYRF